MLNRGDCVVVGLIDKTKVWAASNLHNSLTRTIQICAINTLNKPESFPSEKPIRSTLLLPLLRDESPRSQPHRSTCKVESRARELANSTYQRAQSHVGLHADRAVALRQMLLWSWVTLYCIIVPSTFRQILIDSVKQKDSIEKYRWHSDCRSRQGASVSQSSAIVPM